MTVDGVVCATAEFMALHVDTKSGRAVPCLMTFINDLPRRSNLTCLAGGLNKTRTTPVDVPPPRSTPPENKTNDR